MNKDSKLLAEAYDKVEDLKSWTKAGMESAQIASGEITRLENKVAELTKVLKWCLDEMKYSAEIGQPISSDRIEFQMARKALGQED
jgi:hypothetical protein